MDPNERRIAQLEATVRDLDRRLNQVPRPVASNGRTIYRIRIYGGNTLITVGGTTITGIKLTGASISTLPVAVPVDGSTYADCLGYGKIDDAGSQVWVCNGTLVQSPANMNSETGGVVAKNQWCWAYKYGKLTVSGNPVLVYVLWR